MREQSASSTIAGYVVGSLGIAVLLFVLSFLSAGFDIGSISLPLAVWGALALIYGIWKLGTLGPADTRITAINDMHGQAGANPLANYANMQEYKLAELRAEFPSDEDSAEMNEVEERRRTPMGTDDDAPMAVCIVIAGLMALVLSWLAG